MCRPVDLPGAAHAQELTLAPVVELRRGEIVLAGEVIARIGQLDVQAAAGRLSWLASPDQERTVIIAAGKEVRFAALWPVMEPSSAAVRQPSRWPWRLLARPRGHAPDLLLPR